MAIGVKVDGAHRAPRQAIAAGQIWMRGEHFRRVIAVGNGHVIYCVGGNHHRECSEKTFRARVVLTTGDK